MQVIQRWLPRLLVLGALAVILAALFSDHKNARGEVLLPQGGVVSLPEGTTKVYLEEVRLGEDYGDPRRLSGTLAFELIPIEGGKAPSQVLGDTPEFETTERSQSIGSKDAVAELDVPAAGDYQVRGSYASGDVSAKLLFGTDPFSAVMAEWKLWVGLIVLALLISLVPRATYRPRDELPNSSDSNDQVAPAGYGHESSGWSPYRG